MEAVTITLNGIEVSGRPGMTILELAQESGVKIPTLCHDPHLTSIGACRICIVEDERSGRLFASCVTPVEAGMLINTESPKVLERRKTIIELMLASHPDTCLVCDKGNRCGLRKIASDIGVGYVNLQKIPLAATIQEVNPFIERDLSKCILCAKCIRADHEIVVEGAIDYMNRGFTTKPATLGDSPLESSECTFCGTCVAICPTGALMEKNRVYSGTSADRISTTCGFCGCGCNINMEVKSNRIVRAKPGTESAVNHGALCVKGSYGYDLIHSQDRLMKPLIKGDDGFEEASWDDALTLIASELNRIKNDGGSSKLAVLCSSKATNEESYLLQRFTRSVLGTNNIDNGSRLYSMANIEGLGWTLGLPGTTSRINTIEQSEIIMVVGANITSSAPVVGYAVKRAVKYKGAKLILIDPQEIRLTSFADIWLRPRIGTDIALLNGMANVIINEGLIDEEYVLRKTDNFETLRDSLQKYTPEYVEEMTGILSDDVRQAARLFAKANVASIIYGDGITQQITGTDAVMCLANLTMLTGNVGPRGGIFALQRDCNGQGACDMGALPNLLPGYQALESTDSKEKFKKHWGADIPSEVGLTALEMIEHAKNSKISGMFITSEDPVSTFPEPDLVKEAFGALDFLVVSDMFLTETAKLANVVLPAVSFAEKEGTFTNFEGRVQQVSKVVEPMGDSLPDHEIVIRLASSMGNPMPYSSVQDIMKEIEESIPMYQGIGYLDSQAGDEFQSSLDKSPKKGRRLYKGQFPSGFGRFASVEYEPQPEEYSADYSLTLLAGSTARRPSIISEGIKLSKLSMFPSEAYVEIGESDAWKIGINEGDEVRVVSRVGELTAKARFTNALPEGMVYMPDCLESGPVNRLFSTTVDPRTKTPALQSCAVKLERI